MIRITKIYTYVFTVSIINNLLYSQPSWVQLNSGVTTKLNVIEFIEPNIGFAGGINSVLLKTTNSGLSWFSTLAGIGQGSIFDIDFPDISTGFILVDSLFYLKIYKTTNQGQSWSKLPLLGLKDISFVNSTTGFAAAYNVYKTTNGGMNWINLMLPNLYYTTSIYILNTSSGYLAGARTEHPLDNTSIFFTSDGVSWEYSYTSQGYVVFKMGNFYDINNGAFVTSIPPGNIYRKKNGGNWSVESPGLESIDYVNADLVYGCGPAGLVLKSFNGGDNWYNSASGVNLGLHSIWFVDTASGFVCGDNGTILKTTNGGGVVGLHNTSTEIPANYSLSQNYPNPFNPNSKIKFSIGIPSGQIALDSRFRRNDNVSLVVFDVLGREIRTLISERLSPGTYEVDFDGTNLPSGVYYYQLTAGDPSVRSGQVFTETKKMVLVK